MIPSSVTLFGVTFYTYGFIIGLTILIGWQLFTSILEREKVRADLYQRFAVEVLVIALLGARAWHVFTDWRFYQFDLLTIFEVWNGGLSIIGGVAAGFAWVLSRSKNPLRTSIFLDTCALVLPLGQSIGRVGNWINQELYGPPTTLPWGIRIDGIPGKVHPLFAYEGLLNLALFSALWYLYKSRKFSVGSGVFAALYVAGYSFIRFVLDFIRVHEIVTIAGVGVNQWVLACTCIAALAWLMRAQKVMKNVS